MEAIIRIGRPAVQAALGCLLAFVLTSVPVSTQAASAHASNAISPDDARRAMEVLQDPRQRASAERTLKAIADAAPAAAPATSAPPSTPAASVAAASAPAPSAAHPATTPLEANGLVAQMLRQVDRWSASLGDQLIQLKQALFELPSLLSQFGTSFSDASVKALLIDTLAMLAVVFGAGLALERALRHMLVRPRHALIEHAAQVEANARAQATRDEMRRQEQMAQEQATARTSPPDQGSTDTVVSGTRPPSDGVALVRSQRDGVDHIEAVAVGPENAAGPASDADTGATNADSAAEAADKNQAQEKDRMAAARRMRYAPPSEHWGRLRQLPLAIGALVLDLLPLALFFIVAALLSHWLDGDEQVRGTIRAFVDAYVSTRITMAMLRLLISPGGHGVPVLRVRDGISAILYKWLRRIVVTATFGTGLADAAQALGAGAEGRLAVLKIVSLLVHLFAVILIFKMRRPVGRMIAAPAHATGPLAAARSWLAQSWAWFAAVLVMGIWVIWALGVEDGFPKLIHFIGVTAGVIVAARVLAILILGALSRAFRAVSATAETEDAEPSSAATPEARRRLERYYPPVHRIVSIVINICAVVALLQAWGLDAVGWFTHRTVGRTLLSAILTIAVAVFVAVVIWETINSSVERRLAWWQQQGEVVRAARLRTLLPILRTCLFIAILLVVGLTALNEIGINTTPLLAGASIIGVALGFGSQKLVQDFITGIFLLMENAMQVGDWVTVGGVSGVVEYLSIRTVRLRAGDGSLHIVPFSSVSTVNNSNRGLGNAVMRISVSYGADVVQVTDELKQIGSALRDDPAFKGQILNDLEVWGVDTIDGSTVTLAGQMRCTDKGRWGVQRELNRRILERFRQLGIPIADPRSIVLLASETMPPVASSLQRTAPMQPTDDSPSERKKPAQDDPQNG